MHVSPQALVCFGLVHLWLHHFSCLRSRTSALLNVAPRMGFAAAATKRSLGKQIEPLAYLPETMDLRSWIIG